MLRILLMVVFMLAPAMTKDDPPDHMTVGDKSDDKTEVSPSALGRRTSSAVSTTGPLSLQPMPKCCTAAI
jgi:hypothetical protein